LLTKKEKTIIESIKRLYRPSSLNTSNIVIPSE
jgi:hypothetical protein